MPWQVVEFFENASMGRNVRKAMYKYIGIEDLVASALMELMKHDDTARRVSLQALSEYGAVIVKFLTDSGQDAILFLSRESTYEFIHDYADFFSILSSEGVEYVALNDDITVAKLRLQFRKNLTVDMAKAFAGKESIAALSVGL